MLTVGVSPPQRYFRGFVDLNVSSGKPVVLGLYTALFVTMKYRQYEMRVCLKKCTCNTLSLNVRHVKKNFISLEYWLIFLLKQCYANSSWYCVVPESSKQTLTYLEAYLHWAIRFIWLQLITAVTAERCSAVQNKYKLWSWKQYTHIRALRHFKQKVCLLCRAA